MTSLHVNVPLHAGFLTSISTFSIKRLTAIHILYIICIPLNTPVVWERKYKQVYQLVPLIKLCSVAYVSFQNSYPD